MRRVSKIWRLGGQSASCSRAVRVDGYERAMKPAVEAEDER